MSGIDQWRERWDQRKLWPAQKLSVPSRPVLYQYVQYRASNQRVWDNTPANRNKNHSAGSGAPQTLTEPLVVVVHRRLPCIAGRTCCTESELEKFVVRFQLKKFRHYQRTTDRSLWTNVRRMYILHWPNNFYMTNQHHLQRRVSCGSYLLRSLSNCHCY